MKIIARGLLILSIAAISLGAQAQQYYSYTGVTRVVRFRVKSPDKAADFFRYLGHSSAILKAEQAAGIIVGYDIVHSVNYGGPDAWDVAVVVHYKDMATLDTLSEKTAPIIAQHYGSPEARAAAEKMYSDSAEVVATELVRSIAVK
jgi:hypothetical protein